MTGVENLKAKKLDAWHIVIGQNIADWCIFYRKSPLDSRARTFELLTFDRL